MYVGWLHHITCGKSKLIFVLAEWHVLLKQKQHKVLCDSTKTRDTGGKVTVFLVVLVAAGMTARPESENDISPPVVTTFKPSTQELQEKQKVTIVCLVTDFYPDHINLTWSIDDNERTVGIKTEEPNLDVATKKFSLISRLRITNKEWKKTKKFQCNVYFDPRKTDYSGFVFGQAAAGCDSAKEPYFRSTRSTNLGKMIYILLIIKSTVYGAFITGLMLRKKSKEKPFA